MKIPEKLCITADWSRNDNEVIRIESYNDCLSPEQKENDNMEILDIPVPTGMSNLIDPSSLLVFNRKKAKLVWVYDPAKSILYDINGQMASKKDMRRFMHLLYYVWLSC